MDGSEENDEDFVPAHGYADTGSQTSSKRRRSVSFNPVVQDQDGNGQALIALPSGSEEEDDDFEELSDVTLSDSGSDTTSESNMSLGSSDTALGIEENGAEESEQSSSDDSLSDSSESSSEDDSSDSEPEELSSKAPEVSKAPSAVQSGAQPPVPPNEGQKDTQERNRRRRESKRLNRLKSIGALHADATRKELREWQDGHASEPTPEDLDKTPSRFPRQQATDTEVERSHKINDTRKLIQLKSIGTLPLDATRKELQEWRDSQQTESTPGVPTPPKSSQKPVVDPQTEQASRAKKNRAKNDSKKLKLLKARGTLPLNASLEDLREWRASQEKQITTNPSNEAYLQLSSQQTTSAASVDFQEERTALLEALAAGGVDIALFEETAANQGKKRSTENIRVSAAREPVTVGAVKGPDQSTVDSNSSNSDSLSNQPGLVSTGPMNGNTVTTASPTVTSDSPAATTDDGPARKRARLDIDSSRRLLFGSLGVRNPKTKADEEKTRAKLMSVAKPRRTEKASAPVGEPVDEPQPEIPTDPDAWKTKIKLSAVECWDDDVEELSAPPFPFEQYWDSEWKKQPQQSHNSRKRKRKAAARYQKAHGADGAEDWGYEGGNDDYYYDDAEEEDAPIQLNYDDAAAEAVDSQLQQDMAAAASTQEPIDDTPLLPADLSTLPPLQESHLKPGALVVFKQLEVSQATNWAPVISDYRTATVTDVFGTGVLHLSLAGRDRPKKKVKYDAKGRRLYDRFEMPDDSDEDGDDAGFLELEFQDLVEPKLLRTASEIEPETAGAGTGAVAEGAEDGSSGTLAPSHGSQEHEGVERREAGREQGSASMVQSTSCEHTWVEASV